MSWRYPSDSTRGIMRHRRRAAELAAAARGAAHAVDPQIDAVLPGYFLDRHALLAHPAVNAASPPPPAAHPPSERTAYLQSVLTPTARLGGWTPHPDRSTGVGAMYRRLREAWASYASRLQLPAGAGALPDASTLTWAQVIDASVFYPGPPVFRGATYLDALPERAVDQILEEVGAAGAIDFYCFMLQVHETLHRHQIGEPLLNEVVQAALWIRFLDDHRLWLFQMGCEGPLVREATVLRSYPGFANAAVAAQLDTAAFIRSIAADNTYLACCLLARQFDLGVIRYADYLTRLAEILGIGNDGAAVHRATLALL